MLLSPILRRNGNYMNGFDLTGIHVEPLIPPWYGVTDLVTGEWALVERQTLISWIRNDAALAIAHHWAKDKEEALSDNFRMR